MKEIRMTKLRIKDAHKMSKKRGTTGEITPATSGSERLLKDTLSGRNPHRRAVEYAREVTIVGRRCSRQRTARRGELQGQKAIAHTELMSKDHTPRCHRERCMAAGHVDTQGLGQLCVTHNSTKSEPNLCVYTDSKSRCLIVNRLAFLTVITKIRDTQSRECRVLWVSGWPRGVMRLN